VQLKQEEKAECAAFSMTAHHHTENRITTKKTAKARREENACIAGMSFT